ncbi:MAG TPA: glycosyltransferase family 2 protein [Longimicrobium sp.]|nr:glycosyltransferase family 2 protein [Longimicrobium sp.]
MTRLELPLVSVIIPAFNAAATIRRTLRSALAQTHPAIEVIVVDDGSTDDTAGIVAAIAEEDPRVRLTRVENGGQAAARNRAIAESSGAFVAPLDADDLWDARKIELQVAKALAAETPPGFVYCFHYRIDEADRIVAAPEAETREGFVFHRLYHRNFVGTGSAPLFARAAVLEAGGYQKAGNSEDALLQLRVARRHTVAVVAERLVGYRVTPGSHTQQLEPALANWLAARTIFEAEWPDLPRSLRRWTRAARWFQFAESMAPRRRWMRALAALARALRLDPARSGLLLLHRFARFAAKRVRRAPEPAVPAPAKFGTPLVFEAVTRDPHALAWFERRIRELDRGRTATLAALDARLAGEAGR